MLRRNSSRGVRKKRRNKMRVEKMIEKHDESRNDDDRVENAALARDDLLARKRVQQAPRSTFLDTQIPREFDNRLGVVTAGTADEDPPVGIENANVKQASGLQKSADHAAGSPQIARLQIRHQEQQRG